MSDEWSDLEAAALESGAPGAWIRDAIEARRAADEDAEIDRLCAEAENERIARLTGESEYLD